MGRRIRRPIVQAVAPMKVYGVKMTAPAVLPLLLKAPTPMLSSQKPTRYEPVGKLTDPDAPNGVVVAFTATTFGVPIGVIGPGPD